MSARDVADSEAGASADLRLLPEASFATRLSRAQVLLVLVGFPLLYWINTFTPWSLGLFMRGDRGWYFPFMSSVLVLHWCSLLITLYLVYRARGTLTELGLRVTVLRIVVALGVFAGWGGLLLWYRSFVPLAEQPPSGSDIIFPYTWSEKVLMLFVSLTAGICEETIYRGFAVRVLCGRGMRLWLALLLAGFSFAMIHGPPGAIMLPIYLIAAGVFSAIFLLSRSLWPAIYVHVLFDMMMVLAV